MLKGFKDFISRGNVVELAILMAFAIYFCIVVPTNALNARRQKAADEAPEPEISDEVKLLTEIRDALAQGTPRH